MEPEGSLSGPQGTAEPLIPWGNRSTVDHWPQIAVDGLRIERRRGHECLALWIPTRAIHSSYGARRSCVVALTFSFDDTRPMARDPAPFSDEFARTARDEAARLAARAQEVRSRGERWQHRAGDLLREADRLDQRVRELDELLGRAAQLRLDLQTRLLQGQRLREEATRILLERRGLQSAIHYREWFGLLADEGFKVAGKDPLATFLTQITRSPVVVRVGERHGTYELDPHGVYKRARAKLHDAVAREATTNETDRVEAGEAVARARKEFDAILEARSMLFRSRAGPSELSSDAAA